MGLCRHTSPDPITTTTQVAREDDLSGPADYTVVYQRPGEPVTRCTVKADSTKAAIARAKGDQGVTWAFTALTMHFRQKGQTP
jgi:hypothetical protein